MLENGQLWIHLADAVSPSINSLWNAQGGSSIRSSSSIILTLSSDENVKIVTINIIFKDVKTINQNQILIMFNLS